MIGMAGQPETAVCCVSEKNGYLYALSCWACRLTSIRALSHQSAGSPAVTPKLRKGPAWSCPEVTLGRNGQKRKCFLPAFKDGFIAI